METEFINMPAEATAVRRLPACGLKLTEGLLSLKGKQGSVALSVGEPLKAPSGTAKPERSFVALTPPYLCLG